MDWIYQGILVGAILLIMLGSGIFISVALGATGIITLLIFSHGKALVGSMLAWNMTNSFILSAVPLFLFMGEIIMRAGLNRRLYDCFSAFVGRLPGGLLHSNILACALFASMSGSSVATAATIATVAVPEQKQRGYDSRYILGSLAAGGTLGILIPPSIAMILYATIVQESIGRLFVGGVIPGIILSLLFMLYIMFSAIRNPKIAPRQVVKFKFSYLLDFIPSLFLILVVLGSIFFGVATPTEAAAMGALGAIVLAVAYRSLTFTVIKESLLSTVRTTSMLMILMVGAKILAFSLSDLGVLEEITQRILSLQMRPLVIMIGIYALYLVLGCFFDPVSMMIMTLPLIFPVVIGLGYDSVWFGIILVILIEAGLITPPVGLNIFVIQGTAGGQPLKDVMLGAAPYVVMMMILIALVTAFPSLALWLPGKMFSLR